MALAAFAFSSTEFSVFNSIYYKIIQDVSKVVDIDPEALQILYKNVEQVKSDNRENVSNRSVENTPTTNSKKRVLVRVNQEYDEDNINTSVVHRDEHMPIFHDNLIDVTIAPIYIQVNAELEFTYKSPSKTELARIRDMIRIHLSNYRNIGHHEVEYTMLIPTEITEFIEDVYDMRNRLIPEDLASYFVTHSSNRIHPITDMSNEKNTRLGVKEKQVRIVGFFDMDTGPDKTNHNVDENITDFTFTYRFSVSIPRALSVRYPLMICNRMLPERYWKHLEEEAKKVYIKRNVQAPYIGRSNQYLSNFESNRILDNRHRLNLPLTVPICDDFNTRQVHKGYGIVISFLIEVDEDDKRTLFNLKDLDDYHLTKESMRYISTLGRTRVTHPFSSHIYMGLHQRGKHYDNYILEIDEDLTVKSKVELSLFQPVRVTISICLDMTSLSEEAIKILLGDDDLYLDFVSEYLEIRDDYRNLISSNTKAMTYFISTVIDFIRSKSNVGEYDRVRELLELILIRDRAVLSELLATIHGNNPTLLRTLRANNFRFVKESNRWTYVPNRPPKELEGEPNELTVLARNYGIIKYPEIK